MILAAIFAIFVGLLMGLLGGGGSIMTVPVLVYLLDFDTKNAIITSLIIVAITSGIAMVAHAKRGCVCWKTGLVFSATGIIGAFLGGRISAYIPDEILLLLFSMVMLIASSYMLRKDVVVTRNILLRDGLCPEKLPYIAILFDGFMVGGITGLVGVGGGFLLVPALSFLVGIPMHAAIGTSLLIVTLQSLAALLGHAEHIDVDLTLVLIFSGLTVFGSLIGSSLSRKLSGQILKKSFGIFVLLIACFMIFKDLDKEAIETIQALYSEHKEFVLGAITMIIFYIVYQVRVWIHSRTLMDNTSGS